MENNIAMKLNEVKSIINSMLKNDVNSGTYWITLDKINGVEWALVFAWIDEFDKEENTEYKRDTYRICGKIAFNNSAMQSDYDIDWLMPWYKDGEVAFTDNSIECEEDIGDAVSYWDKEWEAIKNNEELMTCMLNNE